MHAVEALGAFRLPARLQQRHAGLADLKRGFGGEFGLTGHDDRGDAGKRSGDAGECVGGRKQHDPRLLGTGIFGWGYIRHVSAALGKTGRVESACRHDGVKADERKMARRYGSTATKTASKGQRERQ